MPDIYKNELINRLFNSYINESCSSILRSNIEFVAPYLWRVLPKQVAIQVCHRVDQEIIKSNTNSTNFAFAFINVVNAKKYLTTKAKKYLLAPIINELNESVDEFDKENECVAKLSQYAGYIPRELLQDYVNGLTQTYVGHIGGSYYFSRTDFYADGAAIKIPKMFEKFDDESAQAFVTSIKTNTLLKGRITNSVKLRRLRTLGEIVYKRISDNFEDSSFIETLISEEREKQFFKLIK